jgi:glycosyltransferase involved in cell wall biosynthesis
MARSSILIPAYNEEASVAEVVRVALAAGLGPVLVVDDGSEDATAEVAEEAGAEVLRLERNLGKGGAVFEGSKHLKCEVVLLIDADLVGLTEAHLRRLVRPVLEGEADMTRGVFSGGRWSTEMAQRLAPGLSGQRAVRRELLLEVEGLKTSHYGIEVAISQHAKAHGWRSQDVLLENVSQVLKEEKRGFARGFAIRMGMYYDVLKTWLKASGGAKPGG